MFYVYKITNLKNNKIYIGSTSNFSKRVREHKSQLTDRTHPNINLLKDWITYGEDAFTFEVVLTGEDDNYKLKAEQSVIDSHKKEDLYNEVAAYSKLYRHRTHNISGRKVKCVKTGVIYNSVPEASKTLNLN